MASKQVLALRDAMAKVVRALTDSKIKVRQQGMNAHVDYDEEGRPVMVTLPSIPDNASQDLLNAIQGFLDHEVSHLLHTDFAYSRKRVNEANHKGDKVRPALWNIIEDLYVERAMAKRFTGSVINIDNIQRYLAGHILKNGYEDLVKKGEDQSTKISYLLPSALRAAAGQPAFVEFMKDKWHEFGDMSFRLQALGSKLAEHSSTQESWDLVESVYKAIKPDAPESPESDEGDKGNKSGKNSGKPKSNKNKPKDKSGNEKSPGKSKKDEGNESAESDDGKGEESDEQSEGQADEKPENESEGEKKEDQNQQEGSGEESDSDGEDSGEGESSNDGDESNADGDEEGEGDGEGEGGDDFDSEGSDHHENAEADQEGHGGASLTNDDVPIEDMIDTSLIRPLEDVASEAIAAEIVEHMQTNKGEYVPFTRDYDYVGPLPAASQFQNLSLDSSHVVARATEQAHVIQSEVERVFKARSAARWNPGQRKGKINRSALHKISTGDDRIFRTKMEGASKDIAVQLVIDCSGSMSGRKIEYAATAAYMLGNVLQKVGISSEIVGFTTIHGAVAGHITAKDYRQFEQDYYNEHSKNYGGPKAVRYARYCPLALYVFKDFNRRFDDTAKKTLGFLNTATGFMGANADGESIEIASMRLRGRKEARKIMIVMSDGQPAADGDHSLQVSKLNGTVEDLTNSGIEVYGLGLLDTTVTHYYPKNEVINSVEEIPTKILALIQRLLNR